MTEILVLEGLDGPELEALEAAFAVTRAPDVDSVAGIDGVRALIVRNKTQVDAALLERLPALEVVARAGVGLDNIDVDAASAAGVVVTYAPAENSASTAEHTLALALAAAHRVAELDRGVRAGRWDRLYGRELRGGTWGVVGFGRIGRQVADLAVGIGMGVLVSDPLIITDDAASAGFVLVPLERLLRDALVVSVHVPLTNGSNGLIGARELAAMRPESILVNSARGGVVDETALVEALRAGTIAGAALDVREEEPPPQPDPLAAVENVVMTPHVAGLTAEAQARVMRRVAGDVEAVLSGREPESPVNFSRPRRAAPGAAAASRPGPR